MSILVRKTSFRRLNDAYTLIGAILLGHGYNGGMTYGGVHL